MRAKCFVLPVISVRSLAFAMAAIWMSAQARRLPALSKILLIGKKDDKIVLKLFLSSKMTKLLFTIKNDKSTKITKKSCI
jgi:hypothetical protein